MVPIRILVLIGWLGCSRFCRRKIGERLGEGIRLIALRVEPMACGWQMSMAISCWTSPPVGKKADGSGFISTPARRTSKTAWPAVTVGQVTSPEDAVFADVDGDGAVDVIRSVAKARERTVFIHWAPPDKDQYLGSLMSGKPKLIPVSEKYAKLDVLPALASRWQARLGLGGRFQRRQCGSGLV